jgi:Tfp pilus assembly protein PilF
MSLYERNLEALGKRHPELVELIEPLEIDEDKIRVLYAYSGEPRILYKKDNGEEIYIHSAEDPAKCANQAIDLLGKMGKEGIAVLFGFGLGYFAQEVVEKFEEGHLLLVYEATPALFKAALEVRDLSKLLESEKVKVLLGQDPDDFTTLHEHYHLVVNGKFWIVKHHPSVKLNEKAYERFHKRLLEQKRISDTGIGTAIGLGKEFINALMANIPSIMRKPGVSKLEGLFKGRPAIVVAGGPSLEKNLHLLREAKGKAIIIAVDVVLPTLLPAGIVPDMLVAIDPMPENIAVFKDNTLLKDVPFICLAQYTPETVRIYPGPIFMNTVPGNIVYQWLANFWEDKGYIECFGGSVAHLGFAAAEYMGANVIALIGQDLSYEEKFHSGDTTKLLHAFHDEEVPDYKKGAEVADDIFGEKRYTLGSLLSFKTCFENRLRTFDGAAINATEGGLPMEGTRIMRLSDFIEEYCDLPQIDTLCLLSEFRETEVSYNLDGLLYQVKGARSIFMNIRRDAARILKYIHRVRKLKEKGYKDEPEIHNILRKIEALTEKVRHPILDIIASYHYQLELYLKRQDIQDMDEIEDKWERLEKQILRGLNYYGELLEAIPLFIKQLDRLIAALEREARVNNLLLDDSLPDYDKSFRVGMIYKRAGMAAQAVRYLEPLIKGQRITVKGQRPTVNIYISLAELYLKQFRFYEAKEVLEEVKGQGARGKSQIAKIAELSKICDEKIRAWEERKQRMGKLLREAEENYGSHLESGYFYFRAKDYERAEEAYLKAVDEAQERGKHLVEAYYGLAHTYLAMDDPEKAVNALEKAIEADRTNPILYRDLGFIALQDNDLANAEIFFAKAIELAPNVAEVYEPLAKLWVNIGETGKAISLYENALQVNPDDPVIQKELAMLYKEMIEETGESKTLH